MLKKLRWRFIGSAMLATFAVMLVLVVGINGWNYSLTTDRLETTIDGIFASLEAPGNSLPFASGGPFGGMSPEAPYATRFFAVNCGTDGSVVDVVRDHIASVGSEEAEEYAEAILERGSSTGFYGEYRYAVLYSGDRISLVFLNCAGELQFMRSLLISSLTMALISLLAVFGLLILFSKRAIGPYLRNLQAQKQFITDAGHEIKTPLTSISASADVLAMQQPGDEWVGNIQKQSLRLSKLVANLVTLSRLDEETPFPEKTDFSLSETAWEISAPFAAQAKAKGKTYTQSIEDDITLCGDQAAIGQLLSILLDNALRYSDEGGQIRLDVYKQRKSTVIEVFNTCDISDATDIDRLFDRFYRPDKSRSVSTGGYGIGLSIARATAEAHGGRITASCPSGKTILFKVVL